MTIEIKDIINSPNAISQSDGLLLFKQIEHVGLNDVSIDFHGIKFLSTAFLNASIGKFAQMYPGIVKKLAYLVPDDKQIFQEKINQVIENALLGDQYDSIVGQA